VREGRREREREDTDDRATEEKMRADKKKTRPPTSGATSGAEEGGLVATYTFESSNESHAFWIELKKHAT
jgi:hypothetical protein